MNLNPRQAKRFVIISIVGTGIIVIVDKAQSGEWPSPSLFLGLAVVYIVLGFGSDLAPTPVGLFALLFLIAMFLTKGTFITAAVEKITGQSASQPAPTTKKQPQKKHHGTGVGPH